MSLDDTKAPCVITNESVQSPVLLAHLQGSCTLWHMGLLHGVSYCVSNVSPNHTGLTWSDALAAILALVQPGEGKPASGPGAAVKPPSHVTAPVVNVQSVSACGPLSGALQV